MAYEQTLQQQAGITPTAQKPEDKEVKLQEKTQVARNMEPTQMENSWTFSGGVSSDVCVSIFENMNLMKGEGLNLRVMS